MKTILRSRQAQVRISEAQIDSSGANTKTRNPNCQKETTYLNYNLLTFPINLFGELTKQLDNNKDKKEKQHIIRTTV